MVKIINTCIKAGHGARLAIRGYGGIGKTSVALAVCHHPTICALFGSLRFFVECETSEAPEVLLQQIAARLGINLAKPHAQAHAVVIKGLKSMSSSDPLLLILDNAETFLDRLNHTDSKKIDHLLSEIAAISKLTLIITKRGIEKPVAVEWNALDELDVLKLEAARKIFLSITNIPELADANQATQLDSLLVALDCVPLAVKLLAQVAQSGKESLGQLLKRWESGKTDLLRLRRHDHRETSVGASIEGSIHSPLMKENSCAMQLLIIVCYLPEGLFLNHIKRFFSQWKTDVQDAAHLLKQLSLAHCSSSNRFLTTLSPIREHVRRHYAIGEPDLKLLHQWHLELAISGECNPGDATYISSQAKLAINRRNISFMLSRCIESHLLDEECIKAILGFSCFLYWWSPRGDLIQFLLSSEHVSRMEDGLRGQLLFRLGIILYKQNDLRNAAIVLKKSRAKFEAVEDPGGVAQCIQCLGDITWLQSDYTSARHFLEEARRVFEARQDRLGSAQCTRSIGEIFYLQASYDRAAETLDHARSEFEAIGNRLGSAQCIRSLGNTLYMQSNYVNATAMLENARSEFEALGDRLGAAQCVQSLGAVLSAQGNYDDAKITLEKARSVFKAVGNRIGAAQCVQSLGETLHIQADHVTAMALLKKASSEFKTVGNSIGAAQCLQGLGDILYHQGDYSNAMARLESARMEFEALGDTIGIAQCEHTLGKTLFQQGDYVGAIAHLENARLEFESVGSHLGAAQSAASLGEIYYQRRDYANAKVALERASSQFRAFGDDDGASFCVMSMADVLHKLEEREARVSVERGGRVAAEHPTATEYRADMRHPTPTGYTIPERHPTAERHQRPEEESMPAERHPMAASHEAEVVLGQSISTGNPMPEGYPIVDEQRREVERPAPPAREEEHPRAVYHQMETSRPMAAVYPMPPRHQVEERPYIVERPPIPTHQNTGLGQDFRRQQGS